MGVTSTATARARSSGPEESSRLTGGFQARPSAERTTTVTGPSDRPVATTVQGGAFPGSQAVASRPRTRNAATSTSTVAGSSPTTHTSVAGASPSSASTFDA